MPDGRKEGDLVSILLRNVVPAIPKRESEMRELAEHLSRLGCGGFFTKPQNLRNEAVLREFLFEGKINGRGL